MYLLMSYARGKPGSVVRRVLGEARLGSSESLGEKPGSVVRRVSGKPGSVVWRVSGKARLRSLDSLGRFSAGYASDCVDHDSRVSGFSAFAGLHCVSIYIRF